MNCLDNPRVKLSGASELAFPPASRALEAFGLKFSPGGAHISRTMMLAELSATLANVPQGSDPTAYRDAILDRNILGKSTDSTRRESLRRLRELYALDESTPIFALLRKLQAIDPASVPLLAVQVAWGRDPLLRATTPPIINAADGERVETDSLAQSIEAFFPGQYSDLSKNQTARHAASSWTQSGHLIGRSKKTRRRVIPTATAVAMALFLGDISGLYGYTAFSGPWCRILDLDPDRARAMSIEAHKGGLLDFRAVGEVVELRFPLFAEFRERHS